MMVIVTQTNSRIRDIVKKISGAVLIVVGFFLVLFSSNSHAFRGSHAINSVLGVGVAHAEAPSSGDSSGGGDCGSGGCSGSGDAGSAGASCGCSGY